MLIPYSMSVKDAVSSVGMIVKLPVYTHLRKGQDLGGGGGGGGGGVRKAVVQHELQRMLCLCLFHYEHDSVHTSAGV